MKFDIFLSLCQTEVDGYLPTESVMFQNFFSQVKLADQLGFGTAWVAETHLSCEIQKQLPSAVIPHFKGEIGLNTDILQLAHLIFSETKNINVGSAVRNILCNGGPIAHAEAIRTFLTLHDLRGSDQRGKDQRRLNIGFASGRFEFSNRPYGIRPRNAIETAAWPVVKGKILLEAIEIFLRLIKGESIASSDVTRHALLPEDFRSNAEWEKVVSLFGQAVDEIPLAAFWDFEKLGLIPANVSLENLILTLGSHDVAAQKLANSIYPVGVFNLSITPPAIIEETHRRMNQVYHPLGGGWRRELMPRTAMVFLDSTTSKAKAAAEQAWVTYWKAMEGTIDAKKVEQAVENTLAGDVNELTVAIQAKYHPDDRLMLWFDFNNHNNDQIKESMSEFMSRVAPRLV